MTSHSSIISLINKLNNKIITESLEDSIKSFDYAMFDRLKNIPAEELTAPEILFLVNNYRIIKEISVNSVISQVITKVISIDSLNKVTNYLIQNNTHREELRDFYFNMKYVANDSMFNQDRIVSFLNELYSTKLGFNISELLEQKKKLDLNTISDAIRFNTNIKNGNPVGRQSSSPISVSNQSPIPTTSQPIPIQQSEEIVETFKSKIYNSLPTSLQNKIDEILDLLNNTTSVGLIITLTVISPFVYFLFLRSNDSKSKARYGLSINELNMIFNLYFDFWRVGKIRYELYENDYNKYKKSMYDQYNEIHNLVYHLNSNYRNRILEDIRSGEILNSFASIKHFYLFRLPEREIDETIYFLFSSSIKLQENKFYSLLKL